MHKTKKYVGLFAILPLIVAVSLITSSTPVFADVDVTITVEAETPDCQNTNSCYSISDASINVGETITWLNDGTAVHTATSGTPEDGPDDTFDSQIIVSGGSFSHTFTEAGKYQYFCTIHPWMQGVVTVG